MLFRSDRKSTRLNSSHTIISYAVFCLKKKKNHAGLVARPGGLRDPRATRDYAARHSVSPGCPCPPPRLTECVLIVVFFFNDPAPPEIYTLPLPAALPI